MVRRKRMMMKNRGRWRGDQSNAFQQKCMDGQRAMASARREEMRRERKAHARQDKEKGKN